MICSVRARKEENCTVCPHMVEATGVEPVSKMPIMPAFYMVSYPFRMSLALGGYLSVGRQGPYRFFPGVFQPAGVDSSSYQVHADLQNGLIVSSR